MSSAEKKNNNNNNDFYQHHKRESNGLEKLEETIKNPFNRFSKIKNNNNNDDDIKNPFKKSKYKNVEDTNKKLIDRKKRKETENILNTQNSENKENNNENNNKENNNENNNIHKECKSPLKNNPLLAEKLKFLFNKIEFNEKGVLPENLKYNSDESSSEEYEKKENGTPIKNVAINYKKIERKSENIDENIANDALDNQNNNENNNFDDCENNNENNNENENNDKNEIDDVKIENKNNSNNNINHDKSFNSEDEEKNKENDINNDNNNIKEEITESKPMTLKEKLLMLKLGKQKNEELKNSPVKQKENKINKNENNNKKIENEENENDNDNNNDNNDNDNINDNNNNNDNNENENNENNENENNENDEEKENIEKKKNQLKNILELIKLKKNKEDKKKEEEEEEERKRKEEEEEEEKIKRRIEKEEAKQRKKKLKEEENKRKQKEKEEEAQKKEEEERKRKEKEENERRKLLWEKRRKKREEEEQKRKEENEKKKKEEELKRLNDSIEAKKNLEKENENFIQLSINNENNLDLIENINKINETNNNNKIKEQEKIKQIENNNLIKNKKNEQEQKLNEIYQKEKNETKKEEQIIKNKINYINYNNNKNEEEELRNKEILRQNKEKLRSEEKKNRFRDIQNQHKKINEREDQIRKEINNDFKKMNSENKINDNINNNRYTYKKPNAKMVYNKKNNIRGRSQERINNNINNNYFVNNSNNDIINMSMYYNNFQDNNNFFDLNNSFTKINNNNVYRRSQGHYNKNNFNINNNNYDYAYNYNNNMNRSFNNGYNNNLYDFNTNKNNFYNNNNSYSNNNLNTIYNNNTNNSSFNGNNNNSFNSYNSTTTYSTNTNNTNYYNNNNSINLEDLMVLEEKLTEIISALNTNKFMSNECFEYWNYFYNCSLFRKLEKLFLSQSDSLIVTHSINYKLLTILICYDISYDTSLLSKVFILIKAILNLNHKNLMIICEYILSKVSKESMNNSWVYKLRELINGQKLDDNNNNDFENYKGQILTPIEKIKFNTFSISSDINIILKQYPMNNGANNNNTIELINVYKKINNMNYDELNNFYREKILRVDNPNASVLGSFILKENFFTVNPPYLTSRNLKKFTLVLDLDETIIHFKVNPNNDSEGVLRVRPGIFDFLETLGNYYEIIVFTAATQDYADLLIDAIEENKIYFDYRLYRQHTIIIDNDFVKDLTRLGRPIDKIIIVDNMPQNFRLQKENGVNIRAFWGEDPYDTALIDLMPILVNIAKEGGDVRVGLRKYRDEIVNKVTSNMSKHLN